MFLYFRRIITSLRSSAHCLRNDVFYFKDLYMTEIIQPVSSIDEQLIAGYAVGDGVHEPNKRLGFARKAASSLVLSAGLVSLGYQQLPTNEFARTALTLEAYENTEDKVIAGGVAGVATMVTEGGTSTLIAYGLMNEKSAASKFIERYRRRKSGKKLLDGIDNADETINEVSAGRKVVRGVGNAAIALTMGPGILVLKKHVTGENSTLREAVKTGIGYSVFGSVVSAGVFGYGVPEGKTGLEDIASGTPFELPADVVTNPKTWAAGLVLAGVSLGVSKFRNHGRIMQDETTESKV